MFQWNGTGCYDIVPRHVLEDVEGDVRLCRKSQIFGRAILYVQVLDDVCHVVGGVVGDKTDGEILDYYSDFLDRDNLETLQDALDNDMDVKCHLEKPDVNSKNQHKNQQ